VAPEVADVFRMFGMLGDEQRFRLFPAPPAILLDVPVMRADIVEEPLRSWRRPESSG
jgi:hypothetical protein